MFKLQQQFKELLLKQFFVKPR